jgi:NADPH-dependent 2,4-dienoyl-CoA reductase/sulfur reductase-like enzyme/nitrite reductase/ring-hydroxylating ferredoxin subunit
MASKVFLQAGATTSPGLAFSRSGMSMNDRQFLAGKHLGGVDDFPASGLRDVEVAGRKILLAKHGDQISAIGGTCPHAEGVLDGDVVICPWHKAAFSVSRGKCVEPPAVDDVPSYDIEIVGGKIILRNEWKAHVGELASKDARCFVVVGGGAAGFSAVQELRREGFLGRVVLVEQSGDLPYDRTVLSKSVMAGKKTGEKTPLQDEAFFDKYEIERMRARVVSLDAQTRRLTFEDGGTLNYDAALVATGGAPRMPAMQGADLKNVFVLRTRSDVERILVAAAEAKSCVVIGAGFIGMEAAAALRQRGLDVTVVGQESVPFEMQLGAAMGNVYRKIHEEQGVKFRLGEKVASLQGEGTVGGVKLASGDLLQADFIVAGLGIFPAAAFVKGVEKREDGGLPVDAGLRVVDGLYAAGDVAVFPLRGDGKKIRVEHWRVAEQQGCVAARSMLGQAVKYDAVPVFWTIQYMQRLDYVGHASGKDDLVIRGSLEDRKFIGYYVRDGLVAAAAGMKSDQDMAAIIALMARRRDWQPDELHPPNSSPIEVLRGLDEARA